MKYDRKSIWGLLLFNLCSIQSISIMINIEASIIIFCISEHKLTQILIWTKMSKNYCKMESGSITRYSNFIARYCPLKWEPLEFIMFGNSLSIITKNHKPNSTKNSSANGNNTITNSTLKVYKTQRNLWKKERSNYWQMIKSRHWGCWKRGYQKTRTLFDLFKL